MLKRTGVIIFFIVVSAIAFYIYQTQYLPAGVTPMSGENAEKIAWISLATALVSLLIAIVGLIQKFIELRMVKK